MDATTPQKRSFYQSLSFKVTSFLVILMILSLGVISAVFIVSERSKIAGDIVKNGQVFASSTIDGIYADYVQYYTHPTKEDFQTFKTLTQQRLKNNQDVVGVSMIAATNGRILFSSDEFKTGKATTIRTTSDPVLLDMVKSDSTESKTITVNNERVTEIVVPLPEAGGGHVLSMRYLVSDRSLDQRMSAVYKQIVLTVIPLLIAVVALTVPFILRLVRPIIRLTAVAEKIQTGNLDVQAEIESKDEVGTLANVFNQMVNKLKVYIADLKVSRAKIEEQYHALKHEQIRLKASIESLDVGFIMTGPDNSVIMVNRVAKNIFSYGLTPQGSTKIDPNTHEWTTEIIHDRLSKSIDFKASLNKVITAGRPVQKKEMSYNGRILRLFMAPVIDEADEGQAANTLGVVILLEDITEAKILERSKDEFFSIASHELRTPLTAIRGNTSLIQTYYSNILKDKDLAEMINDIHDSSIRLIAIVSDFLDASRLEQGKMQYNFEIFPLDKIIESILYELGGLSRSKGVELRFVDKENFKLHALPEVYGDKNRVKQVVYNLLGNALNYTEKGSVTVGIQTLPDHLKVVISDTGRGMTPEAQQLLFHKFQQAGSSLFTRDTTRGTGLGLYISRLMVEQMHGHIQLESSTAGKGSTFSFTIPIAKPSDKPTPSANPPQMPTATPRPATQ
jgi:signal transduction histidine kinase/HAMP domain-containing protein